MSRPTGRALTPGAFALTVPFYAAKVKVLSEEIKHHVHEEEMRVEGMFAQARDAGVDLVALRDDMLARKTQLMQEAERTGLPPAQLKVVVAS